MNSLIELLIVVFFNVEAWRIKTVIKLQQRKESTDYHKKIRV